MYRLNQFQPALYILVLAGIAGYGLASGNPVVWSLGCGGVLLNWWLVRSHRFRPLPRLAANVLTLGSLVFVGHELFVAGSSNAVLVIGEFLVVLQLVKLWEQRANRDYGQLLVLSLLLMVASAINSSSLLFGLLFVAYLFISLYCCLLFHLKVESDAARTHAMAATAAVTGAPAAPSADDQSLASTASVEYETPHDERAVGRSMRRVTGVMAAVAVFMAIFVFIVFPRGSGQAMLVPAQLQSQVALTGFSEDERFDSVARITQNDEIVAYVELWRRKDGAETRIEDGRIVMLRGLALDTYYANGPKGDWRRTEAEHQPAEESREFNIGADLRPNDERFRQKVTLHPTGTKTLFAIAGALRLETRRDVRIRHGEDGSIQTVEPITTPLEYQVLSTGHPLEYGDSSSAARYIYRPHRSTNPQIDKVISDYARRPEVSGSNENGPLASQRQENGELDAVIARNIEAHLRGPEFKYTLDITDAKTRRELDPFVWFLGKDGHRGHCEYFAGAMALMCQSLGMDARIVLGFKCNEFNNTPGAGYYIVRQSHAHAWVEVRTPQGWMTFDPTNSNDIDSPQNQPRLTRAWQSVKHFLDFFEYTYAEKVVAYDNENRTNLLHSIESQMRSTSDMQLGGRLARLERAWGRFWDNCSFGTIVEEISGRVATVLSFLVGFAGLAVTLRWLLRLAALRRRAARIGIESLPAAEQLRLARQLGFYDDLVQLLARHELVRPAHLTPMEFSLSLVLPGDFRETVRRLTDVYYRVRFGHANLSPAQQHRLGNVIAKLEAGLVK